MSAPGPYARGAKAYRGLGLGQALPVHPQKNAQPVGGLIGYGSQRSGDLDRAQEKAWRSDRRGGWNLGIHPAEGIASFDVDDEQALREALQRSGLPLPPPTAYSTARGKKSPRRQLVYRVPEHWISSGYLPGGGEVIDADHRFIRAWPSIHASTGRTYHWYAAADDDALGAGRRLDAPPRAEDLAILPEQYVAWVGAQATASRTRGDRPSDVDEWIDQRDGGEPGPDLAALVEAIPTDGIDNNSAMEYFGPLVRAAWNSTGGATALRAGIERYAGDYGHTAHKDALHAIGTAIGDHQAELDQRVTFSIAETPMPQRGKSARKKKSKRERKTNHKKSLEHDEYEPTGRVGVIAPPTAPLEVAHELLSANALPPLVYWRETWYVYENGHWSAEPTSAVENRLYAALRDAVWVKQGRTAVDVDWAPTSTKVREALRAIQSLVALPDRAQAPLWLDGREDAHLVPVRDGLLNPRTGEVHPRSWRLFSPTFIPAEMTTAPQRPARWLRFLDEVFDGDKRSRKLLQEWMGYLVSGDTRRHKGMMMIGPRRSGKGTILAISELLVGGDEGAFATSVGGLAEPFGLERAQDKLLLTIGDLRGSGREAASAAQKLLEIIGGDSVYINRKNKTAVAGRIGARVMVASNSIPKLYDDAGVIESRFLLLRTVRSFADREELDLLERLRGELSGIVHWALEGYRRLEKKGRFTTPDSDAADRTELRQNSAPITEFLLDACVETDGAGSTRREVWAAYIAWCAEAGSAQMDQGQFGSALAAAGHPPHRPNEGHSRGQWRYRGLQLREEETASARAKRLWGSEQGVVTRH